MAGSLVRIPLLSMFVICSSMAEGSGKAEASWSLSHGKREQI